MEALVGLLMDSPLGVKLVVFVPFAVAGANLVTMFMPSVKDNKIYNLVMGFLNAVSLNILANKNADVDQPS